MQSGFVFLKDASKVFVLLGGLLGGSCFLSQLVSKLVLTPIWEIINQLTGMKNGI